MGWLVRGILEAEDLEKEYFKELEEPGGRRKERSRDPKPNETRERVGKRFSVRLIWV